MRLALRLACGSFSLCAFFGLGLAEAEATCQAGTSVPNNPVLQLSSDYNDPGNGTVTHTKTGLMWKRCAEGASELWDGSTCTGSAASYTWSAALTKAKDSSFAGYSDWRLPNKKELESIVETCGYSPAINTTLFPNTPSSTFWTSSSYVWSSVDAWIVNFYGGYVDAYYETGTYYARLVRGGQLLDTSDLLNSDTTPDAFTFTAQTGVALSSVATSNTITLAGLGFGQAAISVVNGDISVNNGAYDSASGNVSNGDTVAVRQTTSSIYSTLTTATVTIGTLSANFEVTTLGGVATAPTAPGAPSATPRPRAAALSFVPGGNGGASIGQYKAVCASSDGGAPATSYGTASPFTAGLLTAGKTYTCVVAAHNAAGWGSDSPASASFGVPTTALAILPDSGQTTCYDGTSMVACTSANTGDGAPYPRQDARYGRDAAAANGELSKIGGGAAGFDYTALDASGNPTTPSSGATPHPCVRDNLTGLVWEVKTNDGGLHDWDHTYTWYSSNAATNGGIAGSLGSYTCGGSLGGNCNTEALVNAVNAVGWCGFNDWRMPSVLELQSLVHFGSFLPSIDGTYFPNSQNWHYWSAASRAPHVAQAWFVYFQYGDASADQKINSTYARLVRGGQ